MEAHNNEVTALTHLLTEAQRGKADAERRVASLQTSLTRHAMALSDILAKLRADKEPETPRACAVRPS